MDLDVSSGEYFAPRFLIPHTRLLRCGVWNQRCLFVAMAVWTVVGSAGLLRGQMSDEEKRRLFLQSREDIRPVPKVSPSATPRPKPRPATTSEPTPRLRPTAEPDAPDTSDEPTPTPQPRATPDEPIATPRPSPKATPREASTPTPEVTPIPKAKPKSTPDNEDFITLPDEVAPNTKSSPAPTTKPTPETPPPSPVASPVQIPKGKTPEGQQLDAPIRIEKSGREDDQGIEPPRRQNFGGLFKRWRYLSPATRKAIDSAPVKRGRWKYIIIHNSGTRQGNARIFDVYHRRVRKMQNGLAYQFVIGNGNSSGNGEIEIGNRWTRQINGGHVASDYLNDISLGICLVGDLNRDQPTPAQLAALDELITYLRGRVGKIKGKQAIVKGHKEINPKPTDCPGDRFPLRWLRQKFGS